jgi:hypothetical protein
MTDQKPRASRLHVSMHVFVRGENTSGIPFDMEVDSTNISRGGLAYHSPQEVAMGAKVDVVVERPPIGKREVPPLFTTGKVVRVMPAEGGGFDVGLEFTGPKLMIFAAETETV